jgi:hypothetical protein
MAISKQSLSCNQLSKVWISFEISQSFFKRQNSIGEKNIELKEQDEINSFWLQIFPTQL